MYRFSFSYKKQIFVFVVKRGQTVNLLSYR